MSEATAFPRGNSSDQTRSKKSKVGEKVVKDDFLFGKRKSGEKSSDASRKKKKRRKAASTGSGASSMLPLGGGYVNSHKGSYNIEALSFQKIAKGTKLLGTVREIFDDYALISLPSLLTGYILKSDKDAFGLRNSLRVGQVLAVYVIKTASEKIGKGDFQVNRRRVQVSVEPHHLNSVGDSTEPLWRGRVVSVEDHGVLVDLGHGRKGFCKFDGIQGEYTVDEPEEEDYEDEGGNDKHYLYEGRVLDFVLNHTKNRIWSLSLPSMKKLITRVLPSTYRPPIGDLNPGDLVQCKVESVARNGLCVTFLDSVFRGAVHVNHVGGQWIPTTRETNDAWKEIFDTEVRLFPARILAVDAKTKMIRLTLQPHLMQLAPPSPALLPPVGTVIEEATVVRVDPGVGALLALPEDTSKTIDPGMICKALASHETFVKATRVPLAYVHISKASSHGTRISESDFSRDYAPSTKHRVRILSTTHWTEGIASASTAPDVVSAHVLTFDDLKAGEIYRGVRVCSHFDSGSVMVDFGMGVRGMIQSAQLFDKASSSDYRTRIRNQKFGIGAKVDVKVLHVDSRNKRCFVTAKKTLLKDKEVPICSYADAEVGVRATGYVSRVDHNALYITFYNRVYGRVTARSLAAELGIENHKENYEVGDVVKCRVISRKKRSGRRGAFGSPNEEKGEDADEEESHCKAYWDLNLSLLIDDVDDVGQVVPENTKSSSPSSTVVELKAGTLLPAKSLKVVQFVNSKDRFSGNGFNPGFAVVRVKAKHFGKDSIGALDYIECKLPFDHLLDSYDNEDTISKDALDKLAAKHVVVGRSIDKPGFILTDPKKAADDYSSGIGNMPIVSVRPKLVSTASVTSNENKTGNETMIPSSETHLFMGANVLGYVVQLDEKHGAFIRFMDGITGIIPKVRSGLKLKLYETVACKVVALDLTATPRKILLQPSSASSSTKESLKYKRGDIIEQAKVSGVSFLRVTLKLQGEKSDKVRARIHVTQADSEPLDINKLPRRKPASKEDSIRHGHPFFKWKTGRSVENLTCVSVERRKGIEYVDLTNRRSNGEDSVPPMLQSTQDLKPGMRISGIVTGYGRSSSGLWVQITPGVNAFVPGLELSDKPKHLNAMDAYFPHGARLDVCIIDGTPRKRRTSKLAREGESPNDGKLVLASVLAAQATNKTELIDEGIKRKKPMRGDLIVGRINRKALSRAAPSLMLTLRGGYLARCCITELDEQDDWVNLPLGRQSALNETENTRVEEKSKDKHIVTDEETEDEDDKDVEDDEEESDDDDDDDDDDESMEDAESDNDAKQDEDDAVRSNDEYPDGKYVQCRVLGVMPSGDAIDVSLRESRLEGDLDPDEVPEEKEIVKGYVIQTNKKGCFIRLSRRVEARVIIKELTDGFLRDPATSFPQGRLVVGKVKGVSQDHKRGRKFLDLDMRESSLLESGGVLEFDDINLGEKYRGTVTRIEDFGVFVRLENSKVSGLVHKSECSDKYIKSLDALYDPGDLVKVLVIKKSAENKRVGFSMKASHFEDDDDSDEDSAIDDEEMEDTMVSDDDEEMEEEEHSDDEDEEIDSDDENFVSKLAAKKKGDEEDGKGEEEGDGDSDEEDCNDSSDSDSDDGDGDDDSDDDDEQRDAMDTDVGFEWDAGTKTTKASSSSTKVDSDSDDDDEDGADDDDDDDDDEQGVSKKSHSSRRKAAARRREEQEISKRERALADGTADDNPETAADFERLLAGEPNRSEHWIRYMAYHLSLADMDSARRVAQRAFDRIDFRQEGEKLNVWTALLTMELKFGNTKDAFEKTMEGACQHNNPKQVYLRVCEMLVKEVKSSGGAAEAVQRADAMFQKMCKKFRDKKTVWISHLTYLTEQERSQEAHQLLKRALKSLPEYKHVETMSKFAQLEFEHGSVERGRTIFDGILTKYPKRLDLLFVHVDKEIKAGEVDAARSLLERVSKAQINIINNNSNNNDSKKKKKLSDKQMKSLFKKWYRIEEEHGTEETQEHVKDAAREYVEESSR